MPNKLLKRVTPILPWLGVGLILAGGGVYFVNRRWDLAPNLLLAGGALLLLVFAILQPDRVRELMSGRKARYGGSTALAILFFAAIAVLIYFLAYQNSDWRFDATETNEFTPLPETIALLQNLEVPVHVIGFYTFALGGQQAEAESRLESLQVYTDQLTYEFQDPEENPVLAERYELNFNGTLVFVRPDNEAIFSKSTSLNDRDVHNALLRVINPVEKKVYFIQGHGERDIGDFGPDAIETAVSFVEDGGFSVEPLNLAISGAVPDDAAVIALVDQQAPMSPVEVEAIRAYLNQGGAAFIARESIIGGNRERAETDGLNDMMREDWGITLRPDVVVDQDLALAGQAFGVQFLGASYGSSPITANDLDRFGTVFVVARSVATEEIDDVTHTELVLTSDVSWGETDLAGIGAGVASPDEDEDSLGPLAVGVSAENLVTGGRLVVFGDTDFVANSLVASGGNSLLFTNSLNWLAGDEAAVELTPREFVNRQVVIGQGQLGLLQLLSICLGPGLMAIAGLSVWYWRRQTR